MMVARRHGAAMFLDLLLERGGLCVDLLDRFRKRTRQHAGLAACIDRNDDLALAGYSLNGFGQLHDRPGQRSRDQHRQYGRAQHRDRTDQERGIPDARSRRHDRGVGDGLDDADPFGAGQQGRGKRYPAGAGGLVRNDIRAALRCSRLRRQMREIDLPVVRLAEQRAEFARTIGMNEIVALPVDDIDRLARPRRRPDTVECAPHVDIDHEKAEQLAIICEDRRRDAKRRPVHLLDQSVAATEIERRDIDLSGTEPDRFLEIAAIASLLQALFGNDPNCIVRSRAVDADQLAAVVIKADDPKHRVGGLGFEFRRKRDASRSRQVFSETPSIGSVPPALRARTSPCSATAERKPATSPVALAA